MSSLIFLIIWVLSLGGLIFLVARKMPALADIPVEGGQAAIENSLTKERMKLLAQRILIFAAHKAIFLLRGLEKIVQEVSEKTRRFYHHQKRREDVQEDIVKKQEEIAKNGDYWHTIRYGLRGRKKKKEKPIE